MSDFDICVGDYVVLHVTTVSLVTVPHEPTVFCGSFETVEGEVSELLTHDFAPCLKLVGKDLWIYKADRIVQHWPALGWKQRLSDVLKKGVFIAIVTGLVADAATGLVSVLGQATAFWVVAGLLAFTLAVACCRKFYGELGWPGGGGW